MLALSRSLDPSAIVALVGWVVVVDEPSTTSKHSSSVLSALAE
jgi:hypothetical protein